MPDLLTHVLFAYVLATLLSRRYEWITSRFVTVAMIGATIPDLTRLKLLVPATTVESTLGLPFSWSPLHQLGGAVVVCVIGATIMTPRYRRHVLFLLVLGVGSHFLLDALLYKPSGLAYPFFWPLSDTRLVVDGIYISSDRWPALVSILVAAVIWSENRYMDRYRHEFSSGSE